MKTTPGMDRLTCQTPEMCAKELWIYVLAYNLIRLLMAHAAVQAGVHDSNHFHDYKLPAVEHALTSGNMGVLRNSRLNSAPFIYIEFVVNLCQARPTCAAAHEPQRTHDLSGHRDF
jgi:hypothetical protein